MRNVFGKVKKWVLPTKLGGVKKNKKYLNFFFQSSPYSDSLGPILVVRSYSNNEMIEKKIRGTFWFFYAENLEFGSI